jgi:hypothetical protein
MLVTGSAAGGIMLGSVKTCDGIQSNSAQEQLFIK